MNTGERFRRTRRLLHTGVALLFLASIPWYRTGGAESALLFGLPDWVAVAIACYAGAAVLNALAWLLTEVSDGDEREAPQPRQDPS